MFMFSQMEYFASANENRDDACSIVRHVPLGSVNLGKITALNQLARDICSHKVSLIDSWDLLQQCKNIPDYQKYIQVLCCGLGSGCFCYMFGGGIIDSICAFMIGLLEQQFLFLLNENKFSRIHHKYVCKPFCSYTGIFVLNYRKPYYGFWSLRDKIIIGAIMPLVPGIAFTTSIRDIYNGDYLSGTIHLLDAVITAACIAVGACLPLIVIRYFGGL